MIIADAVWAIAAGAVGMLLWILAFFAPLPRFE
jgi:hypothetical protein